MNTRMSRYGVVLVLVLAATACGESEPAGPVTVEVTMTDDLAFEPSQLTVGRGAELTINAANNSTLNLEHDLVVLDGVFENLGDIKRVMEETPAVVLAETGVVAAGDNGTVVFTLDEPGEYQFFCSVQGHFAAGMAGTITVES